MSAPDPNGPSSAGAAVAALARHARRALAATGGGTLLVAGLPTDEPDRGPGGEVEVLLYEEGGEPRFLCEAGSPVARAATRRRDAVLDVSCCRRSGCRREVSFAGQLVLLDTDQVDGTAVHVIGLALSTVTVRRPGAAGVEVPLARYREPTADAAPTGTAPTGIAPSEASTPDSPDTESLAAYAERVVRHTNAAHAGAVRCAAADLAGSVPDLVIAAEISDLDDQGFTIHWIGADGTHSCPVSFPRAARSSGDLAVLLRAALTSA